MSRRMTLVAVVLALVSQAAMANQACTVREDLPERVLHFPKERSVGQVRLVDARHSLPEITREFHPGYVFAPVQNLGPAQGDVRIPAGKRATLLLGGPGVTRQQCFDCLRSLNPGDIQGLDFTPSLQADDAFLPYMARLTGLSGICPVYARFSGQVWTTLRTLTRLEHICPPYGLTDDEMAGIVALQTVNEMEIVATKLTDAGLASVARLRHLEVLHLDGTAMMTDEGLKALATLPKLRHLRLTGPFTDRGVKDLASLPSLKVLWLESPNVSEEALGHLAQSKSLERLCVPWLDRITDRAMTHLKSMPRLRALGVGDAWSPDAGVATLASLKNLEVLALKGGPTLTDQGLTPLAGMPRLRALQIYNSRITDEGLMNLAQCKTLDSIEIQSAAPISEQAVANLKMALPGVQTLDISQPDRQTRARPAQQATAMLMR